MANDATEKFLALLNKFSSAMLVTVTGDGRPHARPMVIAVRKDLANLELISRDDTSKIKEIEHNPRVTLVLQTESEFLSLSGQAAIVHDPERLRQVWQSNWSVWFPKGPEDPHLALIKIDSENGEYWDLSGFNTVKFLFDAGKARIQGEAENSQQSTHGRVDLHG